MKTLVLLCVMSCLFASCDKDEILIANNQSLLNETKGDNVSQNEQSFILDTSSIEDWNVEEIEL